MKEEFAIFGASKKSSSLLLVASSVNFFLQLLNFSSFLERLYGGEAYASILTMGAIGSIIGALLASNKGKIF